MIIEKVLNNNVVVSIDPKSRKEIILMGSGIAFRKKVGQEVEEHRVEKTFVVDDKKMGNKIKKLINQIPDGVFELSHEIICYASKELNKKIDNQIYISLADHITFALKRHKNNIRIKNDLLDEIRRIHRDEFKIALWAVDFLNDKLKINLPEDEAGFIALHLINAGYNETTNNSLLSTSIIKGILNIIRYYYSIEFNIDDLNYDRLLTHLKYFAKRVIDNKQHENGDTSMLEIVSSSYPETFDCVLKIKYYIEKNYNYQINGDEIVYLVMHIHRVISVLKENN